MSAGRPRGQVARWRQVLNLGERLLALASRGGEASPGEDVSDAQHSLIRETAARLLKAEARLWLAGRSIQAGPPDGTLSELMQLAYQTSRVQCDPPAESCTGSGSTPRRLAAPLLSQAEVGPTTASTGPVESPVHKTLGVLQVERREGAAFRAQDVDLLEGLALQSAIALQTTAQMGLERWRLEQLDLVRRVSAQIAELRGLEELSRHVTQLILDTFDYYYVAIFTLEPGEDVLRFWASAGPTRVVQNRPEAERHSPAPEVRLSQGIVGQVASSGQEIIANDVEQEPRYLRLDSLPETHSEVALPLRIEDRILGVLDVQSDQPQDFTETDMVVLRALADNVAIAIEDARLYEALRRRAEQLSAVSDVSNAITSILDQEDLLDEVVRLIQSRFGYSYVHILSVHPGRRKVFYEAGSHERSRALRESRFAHDLDAPVGIIPWVARQGETVLANNVEQEPRYRHSSLPPDNTRSELTVPIIFAGEVLGVLDVQSDRLNAFSEEDRFILEALADNIAIALRNAALFRSERWRRQVADSLREVAGLLSADVDQDQVLQAILEELERTLPCDLAAVWLLDERAEDPEPSALRLAAVRSESQSGLEWMEGLALEDLIGFYDRPEERGLQPDERAAIAVADDYNSDEVAADEVGDAYAWLRQALHADQPLVRSPEAAFEPLGAMLDFPADYSAIASPLRIGDLRLGVLTLAHRTAGRYGSEARAMAAAFASYAAVAIQNARLYEAAHEQAWVATVLLQVADATQALTNLSDLLATVVRITPMLVGVKACALYLWDDLGEAFVPAEAAGLEHDQQLDFERWRFAPGEVPLFDELRETHRSVILDGLMGDEGLTGLPFLDEYQDEYSHLELLALVPLMTRGELMGALVVDYSDGAAYSETSFDERLAILQGIAYQTAVAVENIRLLKAQKEEAYVSVALLQVAQAVASLNELDDILGAIVRITPILVGVKRSLLFLWNPDQKTYFMSQSYGVPRDGVLRVYAAGEFPLLDAARERADLVAYPLSQPGAVGLVEDEALDALEPPEAWTLLPAPEPDEVEEYLQDDASLLLAYPLLAKGEVLGVLLTEEPDPLSAGGVFGERSFRRLREKRQEIITGISQQAALAIQNERLQRETVERERMERELQLARDIQRTFLPRQLPQPPGWDLSVRWRTAREVGGDFYDVFELPGGRLGLVIADVADKGMPAALFMTLVRTLVRATVQVSDSPADVVARVNDVLVPDAPEKMFVTLIYAVLELESGHMVYTNAGHNLPLLLHVETGKLQRLETGGMALGVIEGTRFIERSLQMLPGDTLLFYTDGVTESFSPLGDMFGEARLVDLLKETLLSGRMHSARQVLDALEDAVVHFIGPHAPFDDLTALVLCREPQTNSDE